VIGRVWTQAISLASNTIFWAKLGRRDPWQAPVWAGRRQTGCVRFCWLPFNSLVPRRYECLPPDAASQPALLPQFITLRFGLFVVLFAFAKADQKQQAQVSTAINTAFQSLGIFPHVSRHPVNGASGASGTEKALIPMNIIMGEEVMSPARVKDELGAIGRDLEQKLSKQLECNIGTGGD